MGERIQKIIAARGLMSRRAAERLIADKRVKVNGFTADLGGRADPERDVIEVDGVPLGQKPAYRYIMLNKPRGVVSTMSDERGRKTVAGLVDGAGARVLPVGRLDMDSDGLLLMTNDAGLIHTLTHPSYQVEKEYRVRIALPPGMTREDAVRALSRPMVIEGRGVRPAVVKSVSAGAVSIIIREGRKRQIRHMCDQNGIAVKKLTRVREGELTLGELQPGQWRDLTDDEIAVLKRVEKSGFRRIRDL